MKRGSVGLAGVALCVLSFVLASWDQAAIGALIWVPGAVALGVAAMKTRRLAEKFVIGLLTILGSLFGMGAFLASDQKTHDTARAAAAERIRQDAEARALEQRKADALAALGTAIPAMRSESEAIWSALTAPGSKVDDLGSTTSTLISLHERCAGFQRAIGNDGGPELVGLMESLASRRSAIEAVLAVQTAFGPDGAALVGPVRRHEREGDYQAAIGACDEALRHIEVLKALLSNEQSQWAKRLLPSVAIADRRAREIKTLRAQVERALQRQEEALARQKAESERLHAKCGDAPQVSGWDGELIGLESVVERTAHDPDSIDVENCTQPQLSERLCWTSTCDVRGKNMFGALILRRLKFAYVRGSFVQLTD